MAGGRSRRKVVRIQTVNGQASTAYLVAPDRSLTYAELDAQASSKNIELELELTQLMLQEGG